MAISAPNPALSPLLNQKLFSRRDLIPPREDVLWQIERGAVRTLTWSEQGALITLGYWGVGDIVGTPLSRIKPYQIECLTSVETSILPVELWSQAVDAMVSHIQQAEEILNIVHRKPVALRLWQFLLWLGQKFGRDV
ncbi:MAG: Crp/Fnr family transcriptional regulator, partial [Chroococcidiopsidaceae cyanobacterium CP_BM_ER_R8_30]|nr:Crp/Fnr family transcriptional regulator [Chroococcidiopsidaceae cyanobacterium CP_BM_ER_R8_30]